MLHNMRSRVSELWSGGSLFSHKANYNFLCVLILKVLPKTRERLPTRAEEEKEVSH